MSNLYGSWSEARPWTDIVGLTDGQIFTDLHYTSTNEHMQLYRYREEPGQAIHMTQELRGSSVMPVPWEKVPLSHGLGPIFGPILRPISGPEKIEF